MYLKENFNSIKNICINIKASDQNVPVWAHVQSRGTLVSGRFTERTVGVNAVLKSGINTI